MKTGAQFSMEFEAEGESGRLHAINPLAPHLGHSLDVEVDGRSESESISGKSTYFYQLEAFAHALLKGGAVPTGVEDAVLNMKALDAIYRAAGLKLRGLS